MADDTETFSTMVRGDGGVLDAVGAFVLGSSFAGNWYSAASRSFRRIMPEASLFRVDWYVERAVSTTLYMRFPHSPTAAVLEDLLSVARPFRWSGPSPTVVADAVGLAGPTGIALRGTASGTGHLALYYLVEAPRGSLQLGALARLLSATDMAEAEGIVADSTALGRVCPLSVIGLDSSSPEVPGSLKFNWGEVPTGVARKLVASKGASPRAQARLDDLSIHLRARWLSYLSMKYNATGFVGWRAYFSTEPQRFVQAGAHATQGVERFPGARMPHY